MRLTLFVSPSLLAASLAATTPSFAQPIGHSTPGAGDPGDEPPPAPPPPRFGSRGTWVLSGDSSASVSSHSFDNSAAVFTSANFQPGFDWFASRNVSLGLVTHLAYSDNKGYGADGSLVDTQTTTLRFAPRLGVNLPLGEQFSLWPTAEFGFEWTHETESVVSGSSGSVSGNPLGYPSSSKFGPWGEVDVALLWHLRPHLFVGLTGGVFHDFADAQGGPNIGGQETSLSGGFVMGGWFGGRSPRVDEPQPESEPEAHAEASFGQRGQVAISNELSLDGGWGEYAGSGSSYSGGGITVGADYFFVDRVSFGGAASGSYSSNSGIDPTTRSQVTSSSTGGSVLVRLGVDIPMGKLVSFWPRASLGTSSRTIHENESGGGATTEVDNPVFVGLYAPLLVHPSPHFFVGFGPSVSRDLSHPVVVFDPNVATTGPTQQNTSTTVGVGLVVGGWL
jgi:hypothetical protein